MAVAGTGPRMKHYTRTEIQGVIDHEGVGNSDLSFLCALSTYAVVIDNPKTGEAEPLGLKSISVGVIESHDYPTGIYQSPGQPVFIVINEVDSILDYDFISELHPTHDYEIYLWMSAPWGAPGTSFGIYGEWYRSDVYKDYMTPYDGTTLGWEDLVPTQDEENE